MRLLFSILVLFFSFQLHAQVNYYDDVAPIIQSHCTSCHSSGEIGPMSLTTYDEVVSYASMIKFVTDTKLMPPFKADINKVRYANERSISKDEKATIAAWIAGGLHEGIDTKPKPTTDKNSNLINYDYSVCMEESFEHYGIYYDQYQAFVLPIDIPEDKHVKEIIFEPGNREIVRSANISIAPKGASTKMDKWDPRYGFFAYGNVGFTTSFPNWYTWMPHTDALLLKYNERQLLPKDSELLMHIHYGPYGEVQTDSSCIHFVFENTPRPIIQNVPLIKADFLKDTFLLEKGSKHRITSSFSTPVEVELRSVTPLSHLLCRSWEVFAVLPDKNSISLLSMDDWDFHWKEKYIFESPIRLPAGTEIFATAIYDNTSANPYNPATPPHTMDKGPHMYDENFECFFEFIPSEMERGHIHKPFVSQERGLEEMTFYLAATDSVKITLYDLESLEEVILSSVKYEKGIHTIQSSKLPSKKGRYSISIQSPNGLIDNWWFVLL